MIDGEPQISFRPFVKDKGGAIRKFTGELPTSPSLNEILASKIANKIDLDKQENAMFKEIIGDVKNSIKKTYFKSGIIIDDEDFPELILTKRVNGNFNKYFRRENAAVVTVGNQPELTDAIHIYHELSHGISTRTEVVNPDNNEAVYAHTGLATYNLNGRQTGAVLEEGLMTHLALSYACSTDNQSVKTLRDEYLTRLTQKGLLDEVDYPKTTEEMYYTIKENTLTRPHYSNAQETVLDLLKAAELTNPSNGKDELTKHLLWARVDPTKKRDLILYVDSVTKKGVGNKIITTPLVAEAINSLNTDIRDAYTTKARL